MYVVGENPLLSEPDLHHAEKAFGQLDFIVSQKIWRGLQAKMSVKNLTDSTRHRVYDREQTNDRVVERSWNYGRDWAFSLEYTQEF